MEATIYVTKWALTQGILVWTAMSDTYRKAHDWRGPSVDAQSDGREATLFGKEWHVSRLGAIARAEEMRIAKIASLERSLVKMKALTFTVEE